MFANAFFIIVMSVILIGGLVSAPQVNNLEPQVTAVSTPPPTPSPTVAPTPCPTPEEPEKPCPTPTPIPSPTLRP